jgi:insulysin
VYAVVVLIDLRDIILTLLLGLASNNVWATAAANLDETNSAITYYVPIGSTAAAALRVTGRLLTQILTEPCFNVLRTTEQLGYVVFCSSWVLSGYSGIAIVVQSERNPAYLESRVDAFLDSMKTYIEEMTDEQFQEHKNGLEKKFTEKVKTITEETTLFWDHIDSGYLDFFRRECAGFDVSVLPHT